MKHTLLASLLSAVVFSLVHPLGSASDLRSDDKFSSGFSAGPQRFDAGEAMLVEFNPYLQDPPKSKATDSFYEILGSPIVGVPGEYLRAVALSEDAQNLLVLAGQRELASSAHLRSALPLANTHPVPQQSEIQEFHKNCL